MFTDQCQTFNHTFADRLFHQAYVSFRRFCVESETLPVELHVVLSDILQGAGKNTFCAFGDSLFSSFHPGTVHMYMLLPEPITNSKKVMLFDDQC